MKTSIPFTSFCFPAFLHTLTCITPVFHWWALNSFTSAIYWSHCAVTVSLLALLFFFFVAIVALFFLTDIIFHFCGVCVQRLLLLFLLLFDVTGVGVRCHLFPDINATAARYCWHEKLLRNLSLRWKEHFLCLTRFCWIPGNSREVTGTDSIIENAHFLSALRKSFNEHGVLKVNNNEYNQI